MHSMPQQFMHFSRKLWGLKWHGAGPLNANEQDLFSSRKKRVRVEFLNFKYQGMSFKTTEFVTEKREK